jgi:hypothetical protein
MHADTIYVYMYSTAVLYYVIGLSYFTHVRVKYLKSSEKTFQYRNLRMCTEINVNCI